MKRQMFAAEHVGQITAREAQVGGYEASRVRVREAVARKGNCPAFALKVLNDTRLIDAKHRGPEGRIHRHLHQQSLPGFKTSWIGMNFDFNARVEHGSAFNAQFFSNGKLWTALLAVIGLQVLVVHWGPAQAIFDTVDLQPSEWGVAALVASSTLLLDETRKLILRLGAHSPEEGR